MGSVRVVARFEIGCAKVIVPPQREVLRDEFNVLGFRKLARAMDILF
jgi:hypothetical protein